MALVQGSQDNSAASTPSAKTYTPPKGWDELTESEKIERIREIIKQQGSSIVNCSQETNWLKNLFFKHDHDPRDGKLVVQPETYRNGSGFLAGAEVGQTSGKQYF